MKLSLLATTLIVAATAVLAWLQSDRATDARKNYEALVDQATTLGLPVEGVPSDQSAKSEHGARAASGSNAKEEARAIAAELFAFAPKTQGSAKNGGSPPAGAIPITARFVERFPELDPTVMRHLIDEIRETEKLDHKTKEEIMWYGLKALGQQKPELALNLYLHAKDLLAKGLDSEVLLTIAINHLCQEDPRKALEWLELNGKELPERILRESRDAAKVRALVSDPGLMMRELEKREPREGAEIIISAAMSTQDPARQLELLRGYHESGSPGGEEEGWNKVVTSSILSALGRTLASQTFASATSFMDDAGITKEERKVISSSIATSPRDMQDFGQWIPWVNENVGTGDRERHVDHLVKEWTTRDFLAAAAWIGAQPTGPLRDQATRQFARTVAPHEPASAAEWALTLPESGKRTELLEEVYQSWKQKDQDAATAFATEQGIEQ